MNYSKGILSWVKTVNTVVLDEIRDAASKMPSLTLCNVK